MITKFISVVTLNDHYNQSSVIESFIITVSLEGWNRLDPLVLSLMQHEGVGVVL